MKKLFFLLFLFSILSLTVSAQIYIVYDLDGNAILATNQENDISQYKTDKFVITVINESESKPKQSLPEPSPKTKYESEITILDWTNRISESGNYYYVEGIVKNIGNKIASSVRVKIQSLDKDENLISIDDGYVDPSTLQPNQEGTFSVMVDYRSSIDTFSLVVLYS